MGSSVILPPPGQPTTGPDPGFKSASIPNLVTFGFERIDPPAAIYVLQDDQLLVEVISQLAGEVVTVSGRLLSPYEIRPAQPDTQGDGATPAGPHAGPGYIKPLAFPVAAPTALTAALQQFPLQEAYLLSLSAVASLAARRGDTFVRVWLNRGPLSRTPVQAAKLLLADYVTLVGPAGWPDGRFLNPTDGAGRLVHYTPGNPGAGLDFNVSSAAPGRVRLGAFIATLVTSATVGNRFPSFRIIDTLAGTRLYQVQETTAVPASTTITYSLAPGGTNVRGGGAPIFETLPVPSPMIVANSVTVASSTQGILAGDQWSAIEFLTEEWMDIF